MGPVSCARNANGMAARNNAIAQNMAREMNGVRGHRVRFILLDASCEAFVAYDFPNPPGFGASSAVYRSVNSPGGSPEVAAKKTTNRIWAENAFGITTARPERSPFHGQRTPARRARMTIFALCPPERKSARPGKRNPRNGKGGMRKVVAVAHGLAGAAEGASCHQNCAAPSAPSVTGTDNSERNDKPAPAVRGVSAAGEDAYT